MSSPAQELALYCAGIVDARIASKKTRSRATAIFLLVGFYDLRVDL
jgi:hypothetical protein